MIHFVKILMLKLTFLIVQKKIDIKNISHIDTSNFVLKSNLASLKTEAEKLDIDKIVRVPVYLSKLRDAVQHDVLKKLYMIN